MSISNSQVAQANRTLSIPGCKLTEKGAIFNKDLSFEEWQAIGGTLRYLEKSVLFWIGDWINYGEKNYGQKYTQALESTGYELATLQDAAYVTSKVETSLRNEHLGFSHHKAVAPLSKDDQERFLSKAQHEDLNYRELRIEIQKEKFSQKIKLPTSKYRIIYADPPWEYNDSKAHLEKTSAANHYSTMKIDQLCAMPIQGLVDEDAVLFMWVTSPFLRDCFYVIEAWGFQYKTSFVWDKIKHNMGHYNSVRHELLLVCTRGQCTPDNKKLFDSVVSIERSEKHSQKPNEFREMIDFLYPHGNRIELFAREKANNWDCFGNEV